eukprot:CAMPEP_0116868348 /NCGR_PEP_ID=MMETSP0418-20121206/27145_1 /TAXON_ID=1158023 /ORGANISM="Astrosyne radiata, Strain 13vi08-1A" /LENGTH=563 /DNA_ID=CAMNT_0004504305 /DNA_START=457 /DNA_END=2145 /DNA_ORIENTATION=-
MVSHRRGKFYRHTLSKSRALRIAVLNTALEHHLLSKEILQSHISDLWEMDLLSPLAKVVEIFLHNHNHHHRSWEGHHDESSNSSIRDVVLGKVVRIMQSVCTYLPEFPCAYAGPLYEILSSHSDSDSDSGSGSGSGSDSDSDSDLPPDIRTDAARAVIALVIHPRIHRFPRVHMQLTSLFPVILSTLATAATAKFVDAPHRDEVVRSLMDLCQTSSMARGTIAKRRDTTRALVGLLEDPMTRVRALKMISHLLRCRESLEHLLLTESSLSNGLLLLKALARVAHQKEPKPSQSQELSVALLVSVLFVMNGWQGAAARQQQQQQQQHTMQLILQSLLSIALTDSPEPVCTRAATALCRYLRDSSNNNNIHHHHEEDDDIHDDDDDDNVSSAFVPAFVHFLRSPFASVRREALETTLTLARDRTMARHFMEEAMFLSTLTIVVHEGSKEERARAIAILHDCALDPRNGRIMCCCTSLMSSLVDTATTGKLSNREVYLQYVGLLLSLMGSSPSNHFFLKEHTELLPWLATFANAMTTEDSLKKRVVQAIVQLSTCFLAHGIPNQVV